MTDVLRVEVAYARPERQAIVPVVLPPGSSALQAVEKSGILALFPEIDAENLSLGIFSKAIKPEHVLREGDRVEIYRPLLADPKEVRRRRAEMGKAMTKGGE